MVTVTFRSSYRDTVKAIQAVNQVLPRVRRMRQVGIALVILAVLAAVVRLGPIWVILLLFVPLILFPILWIMPYYLAWLARRRSPIWQGEQVYEFSSAGIRAGGHGVATQLHWDAVTRFDETKEFLVFFTSNQCGHAVPKRALVDPLASNQIQSLFRQYANFGGSRSNALPVEADRAEFVHAAVTFEMDPQEQFRALMAVSRYGTPQWPFYIAMVALGWWTGGLAAYEQWKEGGLEAVAWLPAGMAFIPLLIVILATPAASLWSAYSNRRTNPSASGSHVVRITDTGLRMSGQLYSGHLGWNAVTKAVETGEFFLFYVSSIHAVFLPKRLLIADVQARIRDLATQHLGSRARMHGSSS